MRAAGRVDMSPRASAAVKTRAPAGVPAPMSAGASCEDHRGRVVTSILPPGYGPTI